MKLRFIWLFLCVAAGGLSQASPQAHSRRSAAPPDLFLINIDTLRADHVHCFGYDKVQTPSIDRLCRDGVRFTAAVTPSPITNTSHASILTGLLPSVHGVTDFAIPLVPGRGRCNCLASRTGLGEVGRLPRRARRARNLPAPDARTVSSAVIAGPSLSQAEGAEACFGSTGGRAPAAASEPGGAPLPGRRTVRERSRRGSRCHARVSD
jgi:hypothetical protein